MSKQRVQDDFDILDEPTSDDFSILESEPQSQSQDIPTATLDASGKIQPVKKRVEDRLLNNMLKDFTNPDSDFALVKNGKKNDFAERNRGFYINKLKKLGYDDNTLNAAVLQLNDATDKQQESQRLSDEAIQPPKPTNNLEKLQLYNESLQAQDKKYKDALALYKKAEAEQDTATMDGLKPILHSSSQKAAQVKEDIEIAKAKLSAENPHTYSDALADGFKIMTGTIMRSPSAITDAALLGMRDLGVFPDDMKLETMRGIAGAASPQLSASDRIGKVGAEMIKEAEKSGERRTAGLKYEGKPYDALKNGEVGLSAEYAAKAFTNSLFSSASFLFAPSAIATGVGMVGNEIDQAEETEEGASSKTVLAGSIKAGLEFATERMFGAGKSARELIQKFGKDKATQMVKEAAKETVKRSLGRKLAQTAREELVGEAANQIGSNAADIYINGKDINIWDGVGDAALIGVFGGITQGGITTTASHYIDKKRTKEAEAKRAKSSTIMNQAMDVENPQVRQILVDEAALQKKEADDAIEEQNIIGASADPVKVAELEKTNDAIDAIESELPNVPPETQQVLEIKLAELETKSETLLHDVTLNSDGLTGQKRIEVYQKVVDNKEIPQEIRDQYAAKIAELQQASPTPPDAAVSEATPETPVQDVKENDQEGQEVLETSEKSTGEGGMQPEMETVSPKPVTINSTGGDITPNYTIEPSPIGKGVFGNIYNQFKGKAKQAIDFLLRKKEGEAISVINRPEIGDIDIPYGKGGEKGYGLAHIIERRTGEGNNPQEIMDAIPDIIENGNIIHKKGITDRVYLERDGKGGIVRLDYNQEKKNWLVTAYFLDNTNLPLEEGKIELPFDSRISDDATTSTASVRKTIDTSNNNDGGDTALSTEATGSPNRQGKDTKQNEQSNLSEQPVGTTDTKEPVGDNGKGVQGAKPSATTVQPDSKPKPEGKKTEKPEKKVEKPSIAKIKSKVISKAPVAKASAKKEGVSLKVQKDDLLNQIQKAIDVVLGNRKEQYEKLVAHTKENKVSKYVINGANVRHYVDDTTPQKLKDAGFEVITNDKGINKVRFDVEGDGTFNLEIGGLDIAHDEVTKHWSTNEKPTPKPEGQTQNRLPKQKAIGKYETLAESEQSKQDALDNLDNAKKLGKKDAIDFWKKQAELESEQYKDAKSGHESKKEQIVEIEKDIKKGVFYSDYQVERILTLPQLKESVAKFEGKEYTPEKPNYDLAINKLKAVHDKLNTEHNKGVAPYLTKEGRIKSSIPIGLKRRFDGETSKLADIKTRLEELRKEAKVEEPSTPFAKKVKAAGEKLKKLNKGKGNTDDLNIQKQGLDFDAFVDKVVKLLVEAERLGKDALKHLKESDFYKGLTKEQQKQAEYYTTGLPQDEATPEPEKVETPKEEKAEMRDKAFENRAHKSKTAMEDADMQAAIEEHGLQYPVEHWRDASKAADDLIAQVGIDNAMEMVRKHLFPQDSAVQAYIYSKAIEDAKNKAYAEKDDGKKTPLVRKWADLVSEFGRAARGMGQFVSSLQDIYLNSDIGYELGEIMNRAKAANREENVLGRKAKELTDLAEEIDNLNKQLAEQKELFEKREAEIAFEKIQDAIKLEEALKNQKKPRPTEKKGKALIAEGLDEFASAMGWTASAIGDVKPSAKKALVKIGKGLIDEGIATTENVFEKVKEYVKKKFGKDIPENFKEDVEIEFIKKESEKGGVTVNSKGELVIPNSLITDLVKSGIDNIDALTKAVRETLTEEQQALFDERKVRDAITKYGKQFKTPDELQQKIAELKRDGQLLSAHEDALTGKRPLKSGFQRPKPTDTQRDTMRKIKDLLKTFPEDEASTEKKFATAQDRITTFLKNKIADLERQRDAGKRDTRNIDPVIKNEKNRLLQEQVDALNKALDDLVGKKELTHEQRVNRAIAAIERAEKEYERRIKEKDFGTPEKTELSDPKLDVAKMRLEQSRKKFEEARDATIRKKIDLEEAALKAAQRTHDKLVEEITKRKLAYQQRQSNVINTEALKAAREANKALRELKQQMREEAGIAEQHRVDLYKKRLKKAIFDLYNQLETKNFDKKKREKPNDAEIRFLEAEKLRVKHEVDQAIEKIRLANRSGTEIAKDFAIDATNVGRSILASGDLSAILRQGAELAVNHPIIGAKAFVKQFSFMKSEKNVNDWHNAVKASESYPDMLHSGLYLSESSAKLAAKEEQFMSNLAQKIPVLGTIIKGSERAYTGFLNKLRVDVFNQFRDQLIKDGITGVELDKELSVYADFINNSTGRGKFPKGAEGLAPVLNGALFAPRYVASRFKRIYDVLSFIPKEIGVATGLKDAAGSKARREAMKSAIVYVGLGLVVLQLAQLGGADVDDDPTSSNFGKIKTGTVVRDIWAGYQQMVVLFMRLWRNEKTDLATGQIEPLDGNYWSVIENFGESKFSPTFSIGAELLHGVNKYDKTIFGQHIGERGEPITFGGMVLDPLEPMWQQDVWDIKAEEGLTMAIDAGTESFLGIGIQHQDMGNAYEKAGVSAKAQPLFKKADYQPREISEFIKVDGVKTVLTDAQLKKLTADRSRIIDKEIAIQSADKKYPLLKASPDQLKEDLSRIVEDDTYMAKSAMFSKKNKRGKLEPIHGSWDGQPNKVYNYEK